MIPSSAPSATVGRTAVDMVLETESDQLEFRLEKLLTFEPLFLSTASYYFSGSQASPLVFCWVVVAARSWLGRCCCRAARGQPSQRSPICWENTNRSNFKFNGGISSLAEEHVFNNFCLRRLLWLRSVYENLNLFLQNTEHIHSPTLTWQNSYDGGQH